MNRFDVAYEELEDDLDKGLITYEQFKQYAKELAWEEREFYGSRGYNGFDEKY